MINQIKLRKNKNNKIILVYNKIIYHKLMVNLHYFYHKVNIYYKIIIYINI